MTAEVYVDPIPTVSEFLPRRFAQMIAVELSLTSPAEFVDNSSANVKVARAATEDHLRSCVDKLRPNLVVATERSGGKLLFGVWSG